MGDEPDPKPLIVGQPQHSGQAEQAALAVPGQHQSWRPGDVEVPRDPRSDVLHGALAVGRWHQRMHSMRPEGHDVPQNARSAADGLLPDRPSAEQDQAGRETEQQQRSDTHRVHRSREVPPVTEQPKRRQEGPAPFGTGDLAQRGDRQHRPEPREDVGEALQGVLESRGGQRCGHRRHTLVGQRVRHTRRLVGISNEVTVRGPLDPPTQIQHDAHCDEQVAGEPPGVGDPVVEDRQGHAVVPGWSQHPEEGIAGTGREAHAEEHADGRDKPPEHPAGEPLERRRRGRVTGDPGGHREHRRRSEQQQDGRDAGNQHSGRDAREARVDAPYLSVARQPPGPDVRRDRTRFSHHQNRQHAEQPHQRRHHEQGARPPSGDDVVPGPRWSTRVTERDDDDGGHCQQTEAEHETDVEHRCARQRTGQREGQRTEQ